LVLQPLDPASPLFQACRADSLRRLPLATQQQELFKTFLQASGSSSCRACDACMRLAFVLTGSSAMQSYHVTTPTP